MSSTTMSTTYMLYENSTGYSLFDVVSYDSIGSSLESFSSSMDAFDTFGRTVKLVAFYPFKDGVEALEEMNCVSEHACSEVLRNFLISNVPKQGGGGGSGKKKKSEKGAHGGGFRLCVADALLATAISESDGMGGCSMVASDACREIARGVRMHYCKLVADASREVVEASQKGLGHSYSRSKIKFNPARSDNMIIQTIAILDNLERDLNTMNMRIKEWYGYHFPELKQIVPDNVMYARVADVVRDKRTIVREGAERDEKMKRLAEITKDEAMVKSILAASKTSMGMDCTETDMTSLGSFISRMVSLATYRHQLTSYLESKMNTVAPNLSTLIGDTVAARLISKAGSLQSLAKAPASTLQILGAEKALFRALKTKGNTPKYGIIYHSSYIGRAQPKHKGRVSRYLANKCSIASRIDSFSDSPTNAYGKALSKQVEDRLRFYDTGKGAERNLKVMERVVEAEGGGKVKKDKKDKKDKKKKRKSEGGGAGGPEEEDGKKRKIEGGEEGKKKKKKKEKKKKEKK